MIIAVPHWQMAQRHHDTLLKLALDRSRTEEEQTALLAGMSGLWQRAASWAEIAARNGELLLLVMP